MKGTSLTIFSVHINIATPDNGTYFSSTGLIHNDTINIDPAYQIVSVPSVASSKFPGEQVPPPYIVLSVVINGVSYQVDVKDNLIRNESELSRPGFCNVGITTNSLHPQEPTTILGLPFLRSVYM